ncbi:unnamed protein product (macronuclear) [Paramecium tetraurelia]|uniref:Uncharacterized protein n=1 Tax=Paramecium tetraurelia TaxID=5888 RepID=A0CP07_PARTE|nr:uncharacterized protein GSPATT00038793001 [Paramecium tetraurelia]CAK72524.1 unnamed protein product [Paramecium tetraurelia]|eukprot:XP_001439921.1 hypothetical protein (macronuclear) [Paramecium tetraurelia strain d4-2]
MSNSTHSQWKLPLMHFIAQLVLLWVKRIFYFSQFSIYQQISKSAWKNKFKFFKQRMNVLKQSHMLYQQTQWTLISFHISQCIFYFQLMI